MSSTLPLADKETAMKRLKRAGITVLDCPISGTAVRMKEGAWTIFASGDRRAFRKVEPILKTSPPESCTAAPTATARR